MRAPWVKGVAALVVAGVVLRVVLAFASYGVRFDIDSLGLVAQTLRDGPGGLYELGARWPYPPGFAPLALLADLAADATGLPFHGVVQLPAIVADAVIAVLVAAGLRGAGASERTALAGAGLVALGPIFVLISGHHGQIDAVAIAPAVAALVVWERGGPSRALQAGLLIGVGAAIKTVPLFVVLALLGAVRDRREAFTLIAAAVAVPLLALAPWLARDAAQTLEALRENRGVAGLGGLSTLLQPDLARFYVEFGDPPVPNGAIERFSDLQTPLVALAVLAAAAVGRRARATPAQTASLIFLAAWAATPNWAFQYLVWGLPFLLLAGHLRAVAVLQLAALVPALILYARPDPETFSTVYVVTQCALYAGLVAAALAYGRRLLSGPSRRAPTTA
jgi:hypothetical protein